MKICLGGAAVATFVLSACSVPPPEEEPARSTAASALATSDAVDTVTSRRGTGRLAAGAEVVDRNRDPRLPNETAVRMDGRRPPDVTAALSRSCVNACGAKSADGCWCDDKCDSHGDCCPDKAAVCDAPKAKPGSCAGACGGAGSGRCYCDARCASLGDCCADREPLCIADGFVGPASPSDLVFDRTQASPHFVGEDWGGNTVRYDYHRLVDAHPECVEHTHDGGSVLRIVMRAQLGSEPAVEQIVSGFSTSAAEPLTFQRAIALTTRGVDLNLRFRCGRGPRHDDAFDDNGGAGYSVFIIR